MSGSENNNDDKTSNYGSGFLEISEKGFGFLARSQPFSPQTTDIFVTPDTIRRSFLREGSYVAVRRSRRIAARVRNSRPLTRSMRCDV